MPESAADPSTNSHASASQASPPAQASPPPRIPTHADLFWAFFRIAISGFGGALPWTRRMFVEEKGWMTPQEFNDAYALCQFLPGPNIVNLAAVFGARMRGATGALAAWLGFLGPPFVIMTTVGLLYARYGDADVLRRVLGGLAAAAAGLMVATFVRMAEPLFRAHATGAGGARTADGGRGGQTADGGRGAWIVAGPLVMLATVASIGIFRWPLLWVMAVMVPTSIALAWWRR
jgi:chromate transporter